MFEAQSQKIDMLTSSTNGDGSSKREFDELKAMFVVQSQKIDMLATIVSRLS